MCGHSRICKQEDESFDASFDASGTVKADDKSLMGDHQETQSLCSSDESLMGDHQETKPFNHDEELIVYYDATPRPGELQSFACSEGILRASAKVTQPLTTKPVSTAIDESNHLAGIHQVRVSRLGKENTRLTPNPNRKGVLVKPRATYPLTKRASDMNEESYPTKRTSDMKTLSVQPSGESAPNSNAADVVQACEHEWPTPPSLLALEPIRTTVTYPGWNQTWSVARYGEYEMELKYGPLRHTRRPWLDEYDPQARGFPWIAPQHDGKLPEIFLYDPSHIYYVCDKEREGEMFYIDLFFQNRFYNSRSLTHESRSPSPLAQSWAAFVRELIEHPSDRPSDHFIQKVKKERKKFMRNTTNGAAMKVHRVSIRDVSVCTVPKSYRCPSCYVDSPRLEMKDITPRSRISKKLELAHWRLGSRLNLSINARTGNSVFSECDTAELRRFDRMLTNFQETNAELVSAVQQSERELKTLKGEYNRLSLREGTLTQNLKDVMKEILELRYRLDQKNL